MVAKEQKGERCGRQQGKIREKSQKMQDKISWRLGFEREIPRIEWEVAIGKHIRKEVVISYYLTVTISYSLVGVWKYICVDLIIDYVDQQVTTLWTISS